MSKLHIAKKLCNISGNIGFYLDSVSVIYLGLYSDESSFTDRLKKQVSITEERSGIALLKDVRVSGKGSLYIAFKKSELEQMNIQKDDISGFDLVAA